ncbi:MAG: DNA-processing protein DprA [Paludibacteraceae bacterium]|nr:DNA-processing protein DprA [Paludibacteraceae bacterium]
MNNEQLWQYRIALQFLPHIGNQNAKNLLAYIGDIEQIFRQNTQQLMRIPGIGKIIAEKLPASFKPALQRAEKELEFINKFQITPLFFTDSNYPMRLLECPDCPTLLYLRKEFDFKRPAKYLAVVGTRNATPYGKDLTEKVITELAQRHPDLVIVSGLAFGIDITAHRKALDMNIPTIAVMGTGFDTIYPKEHKNTAISIMENGALLTEFSAQTPGDKQNFVMRNRIIAGLSDAVLVAESAEKGGSLITADLALSYNRDVFAFPGKVGEKTSTGCNRLIKQNKAALIEQAGDIEYQMNWESNQTSGQHKPAPSLFPMSPNERKLYDLVHSAEKISLDQLVQRTRMTASNIRSIMIELEFKGYVKSLPGNRYMAL